MRSVHVDQFASRRTCVPRMQADTGDTAACSCALIQCSAVGVADQRCWGQRLSEQAVLNVWWIKG